MSSRVKIILVGGGTGGHFYPLMGIAEKLREAEPSISLYYMGPIPYDIDALTAQNITFVSCPAGKWRRYFSPANFIDLFKTLLGICTAIIKLYIIYPDVVVSKGGYTSVPVVLASWFLMIPVVIHESDAVPGKANKLAGRFARFIAVSYEATREHFPTEKTVLTGIPMRTELLAPARPDPRGALGLTTDLPLILILGGSQGAERVNALILESLDELLPRFEILHQTGPKLFNTTVLTADEFIRDEELMSRYHPTPFLNAHDLNDALHTASLIISRAGSNSIHEIALHEKPSILIPIPESISHDQRTNAYTYARAGGAVVMEEHNLKDGLLVPEIDRIMQDTAIYDGLVRGASSFALRNASVDLAEMALRITAEH